MASACHNTFSLQRKDAQPGAGRAHGEDEAAEAFKQIRWSATGGDPVCPRCGCLGVYVYKSRALFKCKACKHQFSVTSGTIFASRKLPIGIIFSPSRSS